MEILTTTRLSIRHPDFNSDRAAYLSAYSDWPGYPYGSELLNKMFYRAVFEGMTFQWPPKRIPIRLCVTIETKTSSDVVGFLHVEAWPHLSATIERVVILPTERTNGYFSEATKGIVSVLFSHFRCSPVHLSVHATATQAARARRWLGKTLPPKEAGGAATSVWSLEDDVPGPTGVEKHYKTDAATWAAYLTSSPFTGTTLLESLPAVAD